MLDHRDAATTGSSERPSMARPGVRVRRVDDRRRQVGVDHQGVDVTPCGMPGPAHLERHPDRLLVDARLVARDPVLAVEVAVVGRVDDQRVVELALRLERVDDLLDARRPPTAATRARSGTCAGCCAICARVQQRQALGSPAGLSETSASLKFGGFGSGSESNAWASRGAGFAASAAVVRRVAGSGRAARRAAPCR